MLLDAAILFVAFLTILAGAELFTNGIEWFGKKLGLAEGAVNGMRRKRSERERLPGHTRWTTVSVVWRQSLKPGSRGLALRSSAKRINGSPASSFT